MLFHRSGPQAGQPRGYAFVTYKESKDAEKAKNVLHNLKLGSKHLVVRWAHSITEVCGIINIFFSFSTNLYSAVHENSFFFNGSIFCFY